MAAEYIRSISEYSTPRYPQWDPESVPIEGRRRQSIGSPSPRGPTSNPYHSLRPSRTFFDRRTPQPEMDDDASQGYRRQSLQLDSDRRASLVTEVEKPMRRSSLPNPTPKNLETRQRRVVGNGVYKLETLPWHESSLRQAVARRAHEKKEQLASPLPLINLRPEAEARLRDVLGGDGYEDWRRNHRVSYLLNED